MGLFDSSGSSGPYMDANDRALMLMMAGLGTLGARGVNPLQALGQGGLLGMQAAMQNAEQRRRDAYLQQQTKGEELRNRILEQQMQGQTGLGNAIAAAYGGFGAGAQSPPAAPPPAPSFGMQDRGTGQMPTPAAPAVAPSAAVSGDPYTRLMAMAATLEQYAAKPELDNPTRVAIVAKAEQMREQALKYRDENQGFETVMVNGQPTIVQRRKYGAPETIPGMQPKPDYKEVSTGTQKVFYDPLSGKFAGQGFNMQMTPGEASARQLEQQRIALAKDAQNKPQFDAGSGQWVYPPSAAVPTGVAVTPTGFIPKAEKQTDIESARGGYLENMKYAEQQLADVKSKGFSGAGLYGEIQVDLAKKRGIEGSLGRQVLVTPQAHDFASAMDMWIANYLQFVSSRGGNIPENAYEIVKRQFFPGAGESEADALKKEAARAEVIKNFAPATGVVRVGAKPSDAAAEPPAAARPAAGQRLFVGKIVKGLAFRGGDPNDQKNWVKAN